jgi:fatty-acyl-CoA synthase
MRTDERPESGAGKSLKAWVRALEATAAIERGQAPILPLLFTELAARFGTAPALITKNETLTFTELNATVTRYARWGLAQGWGAGDVVCLLMPNCLHYMPIWLGLTRIGVVVSLLNSNLTDAPLAHAVRVITPRALIVSPELCATVRSISAQLPHSLSLWADGSNDSAVPRLDLAMAEMAAEPLTDTECPPPGLNDRALYIYTSGTTGLPKAANVSHRRLMQWSHWFAGLMDTGPTDRMYNCLPLYHSIGGVVATGATLVRGGAVVLRERFSARDFWQDVVQQRCTLFQYIGELCRYLLATAPQPEETAHQLRLCCGNGLRADVWQQFQQRFRIPQILEYYAATEGSFSLYNCEGRIGAIGRIPPFLSHRMRVELIRHDMERALPARDDQGRCIKCAPAEIGEAIGPLVADGSGRFEGYADAAASHSKILRDVFVAGDSWYRTGDLLRQDEQGFFYFVDRIGDTFRWKGENVSTTEVAAIIAGCAGVTDVAVYGVAVPNADGRAGMAALVVDEKFDLGTLQQHLLTLPPYARPLFLRIVAEIERTGTFRLKKAELASQGYDPSRIADELYLADGEQGRYVLFDTCLHDLILAGQVRL